MDVLRGKVEKERSFVILRRDVFTGFFEEDKGLRLIFPQRMGTTGEVTDTPNAIDETVLVPHTAVVKAVSGNGIRVAGVNRAPLDIDGIVAVVAYVNGVIDGLVIVVEPHRTHGKCASAGIGNFVNRFNVVGIH